jgi:hypothetical protein
MPDLDRGQIRAIMEEEAVRLEARRTLEAPPKRRGLAAVINHPLAGTVLSFILTGLIGWWLTTTYSESQRRRESALSTQRAEQERRLLEQSTRYDASTKAVQDFSKVVYDRHTRAMMLYSALARRTSATELEHRKEQYDRAFVDWSSSHQANLLMIRKVLREISYSDFEDAVEFQLVPIFRQIDQCLTRAYDTHRTGGNGADVVRGCSMRDQLQNALDCSYAITNGLFEFVSVANPLAFPGGAAQGRRNGKISCNGAD